jgi:hypothetical protein
LIWWLIVQVAAAGDRHDTIVPYARPTDGPWSICLVLPPGDDDTDLVMDDGRYTVTCKVTDQSRLCVTFNEDAPWPQHPTEVSCPVGGRKLTLQLIPGYDAHDSLEDGVTIAARGVRSPLAAFVTELPDQDGTLDRGFCAVREGRLLVSRHRPRKDLVCTLDNGMVIPVRVEPVDHDRS